MTPEQCRKARTLLGWGEKDLAEQAGMKVGTVLYFEAGNGRSRAATRAALRTALETAGVIFEVAVEEEPGVRLRKVPRG